MARRGSPNVTLRSASANPLTAAQNDNNLSNLKAGILKSSEVAKDSAYHSVIAENASINVDLAPNQYTAGKYYEIRYTGTLGIPGPNKKASLETFADEDDSGTSVFQVAHVGTGVPYYRTGTHAGGWLGWVRLTTAEALAALIGAADPFPQYLLRTSFPAGMVNPFAGSAAPSGWLFCDGSNVSRTTYAALFAAIGTTFGVGDGSTTFGLPDMRGKAVAGAGAGPGLTARTLGATDGEEKHALSIPELPAHDHSNIDNAGISADNGAAPQAAVLSSSGTGSNTFTPAKTTKTGSGQPFNVMQPSLFLNFIIKV